MRRAGTLASPYVAGLLLLMAAPLAAALALSLTEFSGIGAPRFVGLDNFTRLANDAGFWRSLGNSAIYLVLAVPLRLVLALAFALLLHRRARGVAGARAIAYLPTVVPDAAYALLWLWILNPLYGPLALGLRGLGVPSPDWLTDPWATRVGIALMGSFQIGEAFVVALAARRLVPETFYEVAAVEGATPWYSLTRITVPVMLPVLGLLALRDAILSLQLTFVPALLVTEGGPRYATTFLPLYIYRSAFSYFRLGYASAMAVATFAITIAAVFLQYRLARRWRLIG